MIENITKKQKVSIMIGVILAMFLSALDQTIVATAMPKIAQDLHGFEHLSWLFTSYMLASTIAVPLYGKLSDVYGRKYFYLGGIILFLIGSMLSGLSHTMTELIIFRAIQGLGAGAIMVNSFAIIGDLFPPAERGKWQGVIGGVFGLASVVGPLLGGWLTDQISWHWIFYVNLPVGCIAIPFILKRFPHVVPHREEKPKIDIAGALVLAIALIALLLGCVWGGVEYAWNSAQIIGLFATATIALSLFIWIESKAKEPIIPLSLFTVKSFTVSVMVTFFVGMGMFGAISYIPLFAQTVIGVTATYSGLILTPMMGGMIFASALSGQIISRTGKYKALAVLGMAINVIAMYLLSHMSPSTTHGNLVFNMVVLGLGMGISMPLYNVVVQSSFPQKMLGVVTASTQLFRSVGGTVGVALLGTVLNNRLNSHIADAKSDPLVLQMGQLSPSFQPEKLDANILQQLLSPQGKQQFMDQIAQLPANMQTTLNQGFTHFAQLMQSGLSDSITNMFAWGNGIMVLGLITSLFLPVIALRKSNHSPAQEIGAEFAVEMGQDDGKNEPELGRNQKS